MGESVTTLMVLAVTGRLRRIACLAKIFLLIIIFSGVSLAFATLAAYAAVRDRFGTVNGLLSVSALYLLLALLAWTIGYLQKRKVHGPAAQAAVRISGPGGADLADIPIPPIVLQLTEVLLILGGVPKSGSMLERIALATLCGMLFGQKLKSK